MEVAENEDSIIAYSLVAVGSSGYELFEILNRKVAITIIIFVASVVMLNHYWVTFKTDLKLNKKDD